MSQMRGSSERRWDRLVGAILAVFLLGIPILLYVLMAPHLFGTWRRAAAPLAAGVALIVLDLLLTRALRPRTGQLPGGRPGRLLLGVTIGALLGLVWGAVAGARLEGSVLAGMWYCLFFVGLNEFWRARQ